LPPDPGTNHLAVHVEDHPLEYGTFEGTIPKGEYGAGRVTIWDQGTYEASKWTDREVKFMLHGSRGDGRYVLFQTDGNRWMIHREDPADHGWQPLPETVAPMLAVPGPLPPDGGWAFEVKWDGVRAIALIARGAVRLEGRGGRDCTASYPELRRLADALGDHQVVLDGEVVALGPDGNPSFEALQARMHVEDRAKARRLAKSTPVTYLVFDLLHLDGRSTEHLAYRERRRLLEGLAPFAEASAGTGASGGWALSPSYRKGGSRLLAGVKERGLEGVVAKRVDSPYRAGRRSRDWVKVKAFRTQEVVVAGWTTGLGSRASSFGALIVGVPGDDGLEFAGKVGTGFDGATLADLVERLQRLRRPEPPFRSPPPPRDTAGAVWVEPALVGEVRFSGWTRSGRLRQPSWRGLRPDKSPGDVVRDR
jgi:bifunctional non-homologous end joining protein LigD